jgi:hypothetical protein
MDLCRNGHVGMGLDSLGGEVMARGLNQLPHLHLRPETAEVAEVEQYEHFCA